jgi:hypothetical protein
VAVGRIAQVTAAGQAAHAVRRDVDPQQAATILVSAAIGVLTAVELGMPLDFAGLRTAVGTLLAAPRAGRASPADRS